MNIKFLYLPFLLFVSVGAMDQGRPKMEDLKLAQRAALALRLAGSEERAGVQREQLRTPLLIIQALKEQEGDLALLRGEPSVRQVLGERAAVFEFLNSRKYPLLDPLVLCSSEMTQAELNDYFSQMSISDRSKDAMLLKRTEDALCSTTLSKNTLRVMMRIALGVQDGDEASLSTMDKERLEEMQNNRADVVEHLRAYEMGVEDALESAIKKSLFSINLASLADSCLNDKFTFAVAAAKKEPVKREPDGFKPFKDFEDEAPALKRVDTMTLRDRMQILLLQIGEKREECRKLDEKIQNLQRRLRNELEAIQDEDFLSRTETLLEEAKKERQNAKSAIADLEAQITRDEAMRDEVARLIGEKLEAREGKDKELARERQRAVQELDVIAKESQRLEEEMAELKSRKKKLQECRGKTDEEKKAKEGSLRELEEELKRNTEAYQRARRAMNEVVKSKMEEVLMANGGLSRRVPDGVIQADADARVDGSEQVKVEED